MAGRLHTLSFNSPATVAPSARHRKISPTMSFHARGNYNFSIRKSYEPHFHWGLRFISNSPIRAVNKFPQGDGGGKQFPLVSTDNWAKPFLKFASNNFLPLALIGGVSLGLANPTLGCLAHKYYLSKFSTFGIFIISGLTLDSKEVGAAVEAWPVGLFGLVSILLLTPLFSKIVLLLQLQPQEFVTGFTATQAFRMYTTHICLLIRVWPY